MSNINYKYTALIVEPRKHKAMIFVLNNFLENLNNDWHFCIYHGIENEDWLKDIIDLNFILNKNRITLRKLNISNLTKDEYSILMTDINFIKQIPTETFLIFQTDTIICSPYNFLINKFLKYDYVGAPWNNNIYFNGIQCIGVGNGGLSLRKKSKMIEIINKFPYIKGIPEDIYFSGILESFPKSIKIYKPSVKKAMKFSIETLYSSCSFGIHNSWLYLSDITEEQCPGYNTLKLLNK
jgi:hypothetical protein